MRVQSGRVLCAGGADAADTRPVAAQRRRWTGCWPTTCPRGARERSRCRGPWRATSLAAAACTCGPAQPFSRRPPSVRDGGAGADGMPEAPVARELLAAPSVCALHCAFVPGRLLAAQPSALGCLCFLPLLPQLLEPARGNLAQGLRPITNSCARGKSQSHVRPSQRKARVRRGAAVHCCLASAFPAALSPQTWGGARINEAGTLHALARCWGL